MQIVKFVTSLYSSQLLYIKWFGNYTMSLELSDIIRSLCSYQFVMWLIIFGFYFFVFFDFVVLICETIYSQYFSPIRKYPTIKTFIKSLKGQELIKNSLQKAKTPQLYDSLEKGDKEMLEKTFSINLSN